jgi:hypothetical protein
MRGAISQYRKLSRSAPDGALGSCGPSEFPPAATASQQSIGTRPPDLCQRWPAFNSHFRDHTVAASLKDIQFECGHFPLNAIAPSSWTPEESQVESCEHQDNANIHCQPFPESVSEEHDIYTDYDGCHRHHVKHDSLSAHFRFLA